MRLRKLITTVTTLILSFSYASTLLIFGNIVYANESERLLAFPGAEGGGKYTTGARAVEKPEIYHVTNLNQKGAGSFADAISKSNRIIVFDVGGTIFCDDRYIRCRGGNLTILGQTAPGDGITIEGSDFTKYGGDGNIILRYLKIRPGDRLGKEVDGISICYASDVIIDHCSVSWGIDEQLSIYSGSPGNKEYTPGKNITVQNCLISEALNLSVHQKGKHGYGSIFGGDNSTLYHCIYAHNVSRNPAIYSTIENINVTNNIVYNWGWLPSYGGEPNSTGFNVYRPSSVNYVDNYFKVGSDTFSYARNQFYNISNDVPDKAKSSFYFGGNVFESNDEITRNNINGVTDPDKAIILNEPINLGKYEVPDETAYETYNNIFDTVGAYIPKRDAIDAKVISDVKNGTGRTINSPKEVGGYINSEPVYRRFEIPEEWKNLNSMGNAEENDIVPDGKYKGYTWIEAYVFDMEEKAEKPTNPDIVIQSPTINSSNDTVMGIKVENGAWKVIDERQTFKLKAIAIPKDGTNITKIEIYDGDKCIETLNDTKVVNINITPDSGTHYYTCRVYNDKNEATNSTTAIVCVNPVGDLPEGYGYTTLGNPIYKKYGKASVDENGIYTVGGSGKISSKNNCGFMYHRVEGDFSISVKTEEIPRFEQEIKAGILITNSLVSDTSILAMLSDHLEKMGENIYIVTRENENERPKLIPMLDKDGNEVGNTVEGYDPKTEKYKVPKYMRIERNGNKIKFSVSDDGIDWTNNIRQPYEVTFENLPKKLYVGLGVESNSGQYPKPLYSMAKFSNLKLIEYDKLIETERWKIGNIKNNSITISNELKDGEITPSGKKINVYIAVYDKEGNSKILKKYAIGSFITEKGHNTYNVNFKTDIDISNEKNIKVFLWDDNMCPVPLYR